MEISTNTKDYRHCTEEKVRYDDLDTYNHVNNKAFLTYIEDSRVRYLRDVALFEDRASDLEGIVIARGEIDYLASILYGDRVKVYTRCSRIGSKSYELHSLITAERDKTEILAAKSRAIVVTIHRESGQSQENNQETVQAIRKFEG